MSLRAPFLPKLRRAAIRRLKRNAKVLDQAVAPVWKCRKRSMSSKGNNVVTFYYVSESMNRRGSRACPRTVRMRSYQIIRLCTSVILYVRAPALPQSLERRSETLPSLRLQPNSATLTEHWAAASRIHVVVNCALCPAINEMQSHHSTDRGTVGSAQYHSREGPQIDRPHNYTRTFGFVHTHKRPHSTVRTDLRRRPESGPGRSC